LLNAPYRLNITQAQSTGVPNAGDVNFRSFFQANASSPRRIQAEEFLGPIGQVSIAGFSPLGTDVYNFPQNRVDTTFQLADELTLRFGNHSAVFGFDGRQSNLNSNLPRLSRPLVTFSGAPRLVRDPATGNLRFPTAADPNPIIRAEDLAALGAASNFLLTFNVDRDDARARLRFYQFNLYGQDTWRVRPNLSLSYGLRYEYNSPVHEIDRLIERTFRDDRLPLVPGLGRVLGGREELYDPDKNNFAPRLGLAYSPNFFNSNNRLTVIRAGYGLFYDQILGAVVNQSRNVFPTFLTLNLNGLQTQFGGQTLLTLNNPAAQTFNGLPVQRAGTVNQFNPAINLSQFVQAFTTNFPNAINVTLPARELEMPSAHHYSASVEQQINRNLTVSAAYVGTTGKNLLRFSTPNLGSSLTVAPTMFTVTPFTTPQGTLRLSDTFGTTFIPQRPVAGLGAVNQFETTASSRYDSLQMQLRGRFSQLFNFQLSYVYSKAEDDVSDVFDLAGAFVLPQNSLNLSAERGAANFDVRHRFAYNAIFDLSRFGENGLARFFFKDLSIATTGRFHTGQPFTVNSTIDVNLDGNLTDRLNTLDGLTVTGNGSQPLILNNPQNPFALLAAFGQDGAIERNSFRAGKVLELDASVVKRFVFKEQSISFRTDFFNFINRANYGVPVRLLEAPGFGRAVNTVTPARRIQFSLKYEF
jgi:hypothetical protein